ncbi:hypothetical protein HS088_TW14G00759 [Tripterygium wilfordii]|uniref:Uncharacterized protein n=1 Tax=Tripterygium wilfordii TaxID=458696 RepID=A0A7J7CRD8_TRIWF|nr:uncharacterized protein LOC120014620 [Tripterygium wilfordii]KAF5736614.1 hypothetical protein HS088_TW14G00759 [Tripterygium wilfordii]
MAKSSKDDPEFWLPTEFLASEDFAMETEILKKKASEVDGLPPSLSFPMEFPYEFDSFSSYCSALSSPGESVVGSAETESSDEEDFLTGMTRRLNQSSISETQKLFPKPESKWVMAGSPESTLIGAGNWSVSSNGSPSGVSSPMTQFGEGYNGWDLIYEAAGQVAKLKMTNEAPKVHSSNFQAREPLGPSRSQNPVTPVRGTSQSGFTRNVSQMNLQYQRARLEQLLKQQQQKQCASVWARQVDLNQRLQNQQIQNGGERAFGFESGMCGHPVTVGAPQSTWPRLQQSPLRQSPQFAGHSQRLKPGMKTTVGSGSVVKRECAGTGVFLPRRFGNNPEPLKRTGCSTAILPAKVVHALNMSFDGMNAHSHTQPSFNTVLPSDYDALVARRYAILSLQKRMLQQENHELLRLPQEWTY